MNVIISRPRRRTVKEHGPDPIDVDVGRRVRVARELAHMTQVDVAAHLGFSFQLVQKYEQGEIRISASRLFQFSRLLQKPVDYFFFFAIAGTESSPAPNGYGPGELELVQAYRAITNPEVRERLCELVKGMSQQPPRDVPNRVPTPARRSK
jgi:transcriptional regulator with XRE-family HTH domain